VLLRANKFLEALGRDIEIIEPHLREVALKAEDVLSEPGEMVRTVYFLHQGLVAKLAIFEDGSEIECALVGREGAVGATSAIGVRSAVTRDVCLVDASASIIDAEELQRAAQVSEPIHRAIERYGAWKMSYVIRNGTCNARHSVEQRLCRWLLTCSDLLERRQIDLRQEVFGSMLGVQRTTINPILQQLRAEGVLDIGRARVTILDPERLRRSSCGCYGAMRRAEAHMAVMGAPTRRAS
jgi:CRP-like cAMP-binding protein